MHQNILKSERKNKLIDPSTKQKWQINPSLSKYMLWNLKKFAVRDVDYLFFAFPPLSPYITHHLFMGPIYHNLSKSSRLPLIRVFAWWIPFNLRLISIVCPTLACHPGPSVLSSCLPVHLPDAPVQQQCFSHLYVIVSVLGFCRSTSFLPASLFPVKIFALPSSQ